MTHYDVYVKLFKFPNYKVREAVTVNDDGSYTILLDDRLSKDEQYERYRHALEHIYNNDFEDPDVQKAELRAHNVTLPEDLPYQTEKYKGPEKIIRSEEFEKQMAELRRKREIAYKKAETRLAKIRKIRESWGYDAFVAEENRWADPDR